MTQKIKTKNELWQELKTADSWEVFNKTWQYFKQDTWLLPGCILRSNFIQAKANGNAQVYTTPGHFEYALEYQDVEDKVINKLITLRQNTSTYTEGEHVLVCNCLDLTKQLLATGQFKDRSYFYPEYDISVLQFRSL